MISAFHAFVASHAEAFAQHVILSSIVLAAALLLSLAPRLTARTRFVLVAAGMAKFLLPSSLLVPFFERAFPTRPAIFTLTASAGIPASMQSPVAPAVHWMDVAAAIWIVVALVLIAGSLIVSRRLVVLALRNSAPPTSRDLAALNAARRRCGLHESVDMVRSPLCEAPAVLRVLRPVVVLPADSAGALDDDELESLLCHECAHVARRDNLIGLAEALVRHLFWFNPLMWIAHRRLSLEREKACDEVAAGAGVDLYAGALTKVCDTIIGRPIAGVACMASSNLKGRIESIMRYETLRDLALPHGLIAALAVAIVIITTVGAAAVTAEKAPDLASPYSLVTRLEPGVTSDFLLTAKIIDNRTSRVVLEPRLPLTAGKPTLVTKDLDDVNVSLLLNVDPAGNGSAILRATEHGVPVQDSKHAMKLSPRERNPEFQGQPISMGLTDADLRDVLKTFARITGIDMDVAPEVQGKVTFHITDMPWDEALHRILTERGFKYELRDKKLYVTK